MFNADDPSRKAAKYRWINGRRDTMKESRRWLIVAGACLTSLVAAAPATADEGKEYGKDLQAYKSAQGKFDREFSFKVFKWADKNYVNSYDDQVKVHYKVKVVKSQPYDKDFSVYGAIKVYNPNKHKAKDVKVYDQIGDKPCKVWGGSDRIEGYSWATFYYQCDDLYGFKAGDYGKNVAVVKWDGKSVKSPHYSTYAQAYFKFDKPAYVKNDCTWVKDTLEYYTTSLGQACYSKQFEYDKYLKVPKYGCKDFVNWAEESASYSKAYAKVRVCRVKKDDYHPYGS